LFVDDEIRVVALVEDLERLERQAPAMLSEEVVLEQFRVNSSLLPVFGSTKHTLVKIHLCKLY